MTEHPLISGFETPPQGALLAQTIVNDARFGLAHERSIGYAKGWHRHNFWNFAFPRGSSVIVFTTRDGGRYEVDSRSFLIMAPGVEHEQSAKTSVWDNFALFPAADEWLDGDALPLGEPISLHRRPTLVDEVVSKLFVDVVLARKPPEIARHTYRFVLSLIREELRHGARQRELPKAEGADDPELRAIEYLENHLFEAINPTLLARRVGLSRATLYRRFTAAFGRSVAAYVRERRLEEARELLRRGDHSVGDVALLVGYDSLFAFSKAYKAFYGSSPSHDLGAQ